MVRFRLRQGDLPDARTVAHGQLGGGPPVVLRIETVDALAEARRSRADAQGTPVWQRPEEASEGMPGLLLVDAGQSGLKIREAELQGSGSAERPDIG